MQLDQTQRVQTTQAPRFCALQPQGQEVPALLALILQSLANVLAQKAHAISVNNLGEMEENISESDILQSVPLTGEQRNVWQKSRFSFIVSISQTTIYLHTML